MDIALTKQQLQETLREMGVENIADLTLEELKATLQKENRRRWLQAAGLGAGRREGRLVRRRARAKTPELPADEAAPPATATTAKTPERPPRPDRPLAREPFMRGRARGAMARPKAAPVDAPIFDRSKDVEAIVLRRAGGFCELCDRPEDAFAANDGPGLQPYFFGDGAAGELKRIKTMAAVCPACLTRLRTEALPNDLKKLKRQARRKLISKVAVQTRGRAPQTAKKRTP